MRKNLIAMSAVAALGSLGLVGGAAAQMAVSGTGTGHQLVFPYFTTQGDNATSIAIVNTDTTNGKVVKVRFRGARNSDDVLDFQVLMSPGDVWTAAVTQDAATGLSKLTTSDASCTVPASVRTNGSAGTLFVTSRVDPQRDAAPQTREGYIEVINMADIQPATGATTTTSTLFYTVKHRSGVADCSDTIISAAFGTGPNASNGLTTAANVGGFGSPTGRLGGDYVIVQQTNSAAWSGEATALAAGAGDGSAAKLVVWPQSSTAVPSSLGTVGAAGQLTADPLMEQNAIAANNKVTLRQYDLPDLSTPYAPASTDVGTQLQATMSALRSPVAMTQFETSPGIAGLTDIVVSQPTRRYQVAVDYKSGTSSTAAAAVLATTGGGFTVNPIITAAGGTTNAFINSDRTVCLQGLTITGIYDREETTTTSGGYVVSPGDPTTFVFCGEVAVTALNNAAANATALAASLTRTNVTVAPNNGWLTIGTSAFVNGASTGLPLIGGTFLRASNGVKNFGFTYAWKTR